MANYDQNSLNGVNGDQEVRRDGVCPAPVVPKHVLLKNHVSNGAIADRLLAVREHEAKIGCAGKRCAASIVRPPIPGYLRTDGKNRPREQTVKEAMDFIQEYYENMKQFDTEKFTARKAEVCDFINRTGTYELTYDELKFGAKTAWRNAPRCIGRIQWKNLELLDARKVDTAEGMFLAICKHLKYATNGGNIRSALTVFRQRQEHKKDLLMWNSQLIRYAGYTQPYGSVVGDPVSCQFTKVCEEIGWKGKGGMFDVLPLVFQVDGKHPQWFDIPSELVLEVQLTHPKYDWFSDLGLKWYAVPCVADMMFDCGGLQFQTAPFNGWYMGPEIGARNLCDSHRYNMLEPIAKRIGLDVSSNTSLWKDQSLLETNIAVLHSFKMAKATIIDHHSASESFMKHLGNEQRLRGGCPADWVWIVPPISGSITPVFHQEMLSYQMKPAFLYQDPPRMTRPDENGTSEKKPLHKLKTVAIIVRFLIRVNRRLLAYRPKATIVYATETGKSERYARLVGETFSLAFDVKVMNMDDYDTSRLDYDRFLIVVTSTFGNGEPPMEGEEFLRALKELVTNDNNNNHQNNTYGGLHYSVFGLGSTAYPEFCAFACTVDTLLDKLGGQRLMEIRKGDELGREEEAFKHWRQDIFRVACETFPVNRGVDVEGIISVLGSTKDKDENKTYRLKVYDQKYESDHLDVLRKLHGKNVQPCKLVTSKHLQSSTSSRSTILVQLDTQGAVELRYEPGDHAVVFPTNDKELVDWIVDRIESELLSDTIVQLESTPGGDSQKWNVEERLPPCSVTMALLRYLDITTPPTADFMRMLADFAQDADDQKHMLHLAESDRDYKIWVNTHHPNLVDVISAYPSLEVPAWFLVKYLPVLKPRYYSISSSPKLHPNEIHLTLAVVKYWTEGNVRNFHKGVCSTWLNERKHHDIVPTIIKRAHSFKLPADISKPAILIGPGTGIAPFRSFWQQRQHNQKHDGWNHEAYGKMLLIFGCRHPDIDDIYREETQRAVATGTLSQVFTAYSRVPGKRKTYVQDLLMEESALVYRYIHEEKGHFYVCGDNLMAVDVRKMLLKVMGSRGNMTPQEAESYICSMRETGRYHEDVFGVFMRPSHHKTPATNTKQEMKALTQDDVSHYKITGGDGKNENMECQTNGTEDADDLENYASGSSSGKGQTKLADYPSAGILTEKTPGKVKNKRKQITSPSNGEATGGKKGRF